MTRGILEICNGASAGRKIVLEPGKPLKVGRTERADALIGDDPYLSGAHFEILWDGKTCQVRDLDSVKGTMVGGLEAKEAPVAHGEWIRAGFTDFLFHVEDYTPLSLDEEDGPLETWAQIQNKERALLYLLERAEKGLLFAVVDCSRDDRILLLMSESVDRCQSLYEGAEGLQMADVAPYLVRLDASSNLLSHLVTGGWTKRWGIYFESGASFEALRKQLRSLLMVENERKERLYFRFYDPAVLSAFLPTCTAAQRGAVFGEIEAFLVEGRGGELCVYREDSFSMAAHAS